MTIREAAERLTRIYAGESYQEVYSIEPTGCGLQHTDEATVIEWALKEIAAAKALGITLEEAK